MELEFGTHVLERMEQRGVSRRTVLGIVADPDVLTVAADEHHNNHYVSRVEHLGGARVTVVVDPYKRPNKVVTVTREDPG